MRVPTASQKALLEVLNCLFTPFSQLRIVGNKSNSSAFCKSVNQLKTIILRSKLPFRVGQDAQKMRQLSTEEWDYSRVAGTG